MAYHSLADEIYFGGAAGAGKTGLGIGLAITQHRRSLILRREATNAVEIVEQLKKFTVGGKWKSSGYGGTMRTADGRSIEVAGCPNEDDKQKYQGRPHDLIVFDEAPQFSRGQFRFISAWNRHEDPAQRCRILMPGNPPTKPEDRWIVEEFAPWLDSEYPNPARQGELRWYTVLDDKLIWVDGPEPFDHNGERITPKSRTFIPGLLSDNPILAATDYGARLQALPEPLRSQLLYGDMQAGTEDDAWQVIPTEWVRKAMTRWTDSPPEEQSALGVDVARGGKDKTVIAARHGSWFARLKKYPGVETPDGPSVATLVIQSHQGKCPVYVDVIGYGSSAYDYLKEQTWFHTFPVNNAEGTGMRDKSGRLGFLNIRAASYWKLREALDPNSGQKIALPPDNELLADLCAPRYKLMSAGIQVEKKVDIIERLGRSPDCADAVVLAYWGYRPFGEQKIFQVLSVGVRKGKGLRLVVCSEEEMRGLQVEERCLLISLRDPDYNRVETDFLNGSTGCATKEASHVSSTNSAVANGEILRRTNGDLIPLGAKKAEVGNEEGLACSSDYSITVAGGEQPSGHCLVKLLDSLALSFVDLSPEERQERWGEVVPPYGRPPAELVMQREHGKKLWGWILKRRDPSPEVIVFCDNGDRRALSVAYAVADQMRLPRKAHVLRPSDPENKNEGEAPNRHVYQMTITSRAMVM